MNSKTWLECLKRLHAVFPRAVPNPYEAKDNKKSEVLFEMLQNLNDQAMLTATERAVMMSKAPENLVLFFRDTIANESVKKRNQEQQDRYFGRGAGTREVSIEQHANFWLCIQEAMILYEEDRNLYDEWVAVFNSKWDELSGQSLLHYLKSELYKLREMSKEKRGGVRDLSKAKAVALDRLKKYMQEHHNQVETISPEAIAETIPF